MRGVTRRELLAAAATGTVALASGAKGVTGQSAGDSEWPMHQRDAANTGVAASGAGPAGPVAPRWTVTPGEQLWAGPVVADGTVYVGVDDEDVALVALDARDGTERWRYRPGFEVVSTPAVVDGTVFVPLWVYPGKPGLVALDAADGSVRWRGPAALGTPALTVHRGTVYARTQDRLWALDAEAGTPYWRREINTLHPTEPAVADGTVFVPRHEDGLLAVDAATGESRWSTEIPGYFNSAPTVAGDTVYVTSGNLGGVLTAVNRADGEQEWQFLFRRNVWGSPTVADGIVYVGIGEGWVYALLASTGIIVWRVRNKGVYESAPVVVDDTVIVGSTDDSLYALSRWDGSVRWRYELSDWVTTSPAVVDGTAYVGSRDGTLYALEHWERSLPVLGVGIGGLAAAGIAAGYGILRDSTDD